MSLDCGSLVGRTEAGLAALLGAPTTRRVIGDQAWLVYRDSGLTLRARCRRAAESWVCASWDASFEQGFDTLAELATAVGLWPAVNPDLRADECGMPLVRRAVRCPESGALHSMTATLRDGRFTRISVFDEAPDWL